MLRNRIVIKRYFNVKPTVAETKSEVENTEQEVLEVVDGSVVKTKNKRSKKNEKMETEDKIKEAEAIVDELAPNVKVIKKDKGLIERTESSKIILTEDNRQVLND